MSHRVYTLWASLKGEQEPCPWMIAAEDEYAWEGDPDRCERVFQTARDLCDRNEWDYREVTINVTYGDICESFRPGEVEAQVVRP